MTCRNNKLFSILLFALGIFLSNLPSAQAQTACQPALYLFRHAEDLKNAVGLTDVGKRHAALYPEMIEDLTAPNSANLCPVKRVFAMWDRNKNGTTNPYFTAEKLAEDVGNKRMPPETYVPEMFFKDPETDPGAHTYYLCEYITGDTNCQNETTPLKFDRNALAKYDGDVNSRLASYLSAWFQTHSDASVALFHTSQGMPGLSLVFGVLPVSVKNCDARNCEKTVPPVPATRKNPACDLPDSAVHTSEPCWETDPDKGGKNDPLLAWPGLQRSAVDIFFYSGGNFVNQYALGTDRNKLGNLLSKISQQCYYSYDGTNKKILEQYYCQYSGNMNKNIPTDKLGDVHGKICFLPTRNKIVANDPKDNPDGDSYGHCVDKTPAHDFDGDGKSDVLLESTGGGIAMWRMGPNATIGSAVAVGSTTPGVWTIIGQRDLDGDGNADILLRAGDGSIGLWLMNADGTIKSATALGNLGTSWNIVGTGDFNNDGIGDILWYHTSGTTAIWYMNSSGGLQSAVGVGTLPLQWSVAGTGDFDGDGIRDMLWSHTSGATAVWLMNSDGTIKSAVGLGTLPAGTWSIAGIGDFNGDGISDILLSASGNGVGIWFMDASGNVSSAQSVGTMASGWTIAQTGDFNGDGKSDILWNHAASGSIGAWLMNDASIASAVGIGSLPPATWSIVTANSD